MLCYVCAPIHSVDVMCTYTHVIMLHPDNFIAGAVALSTAFTVMHPIDTIKTRLQAQHGTGSNMACLVMSCDVMSCHVMSCHVMSIIWNGMLHVCDVIHVHTIRW